MRILVVGSGGREHALVWKLSQSERTSALFCAPGNPGTALIARNLPIPVHDLDGLVTAAKHQKIDLVVVGPEQPLARGLVDRLVEAGIATCGPTAAAARIESSKSWAKEVMAAAGVPTAGAVVVTEIEEARQALASFTPPVVIKADGLAAGKGVVIAETSDSALATLSAFLEQRQFGDAGSRVLIEEFLDGREVSIFGLTDGKTVYTLSPACDYKRAFDADEGPNTGGMGAYAPVPVVDAGLQEEIRTSILQPVVREMRNRGCPMRGILYAGLMLTTSGPKVLEFNARLGDPETQIVLPMLDGDLVELLGAIAEGRLDRATPPKTFGGAAVAVVLAAGGYPDSYKSGEPIQGLDCLPNDALVFQAGTRLNESGQLVTAGGRVLSVVGRGANVAAARERAYGFARTVHFNDCHFRSDIAAREISQV
ncbi:MAG TPA: phosphoribosylamine--glycine ligase [Thermomicrobiales bacterium]|nr:phosphoribosylamine--glycine ligase [Thermomicrobiales bacterium]